MNNFKIKRFWSTLRWYFCENRSRLLSWSIGLALIFMAVDSIIIHAVLVQSHHAIPQEVPILSSIGANALISAIAFIIMLSLVFSPLRDKKKRIAYLTLPATHLEKYVAVMVYTLVIWPIFILLAFLLGDTLRMVIFGIMGNGWLSSITLVSKVASESEGTITWPIFLDWLHDFVYNLWLCSIYILAGTWLRKNVFSLTTLALIAVAITFIVITNHPAIHIPSLFEMNGKIAVDVHPLAYASIIFAMAATAFNFWASYQLFKRFQLITSKWTNL